MIIKNLRLDNGWSQEKLADLTTLLQLEHAFDVDASETDSIEFTNRDGVVINIPATVERATAYRNATTPKEAYAALSITRSEDETTKFNLPVSSKQEGLRYIAVYYQSQGVYGTNDTERELVDQLRKLDKMMDNELSLSATYAELDEMRGQYPDAIIEGGEYANPSSDNVYYGHFNVEKSDTLDASALIATMKASYTKNTN